jgi:cell division protein FtsB
MAAEPVKDKRESTGKRISDDICSEHESSSGTSFRYSSLSHFIHTPLVKWLVTIAIVSLVLLSLSSLFVSIAALTVSSSESTSSKRTDRVSPALSAPLVTDGTGEIDQLKEKVRVLEERVNKLVKNMTVTKESPELEGTDLRLNISALSVRTEVLETLVFDYFNTTLGSTPAHAGMSWTRM